MRKKLAILLTVILIISLSVMGITSQDKAYAKEAQMYLEIPESVKKENEFTVKIILNSDVNLYSVNAYLFYSEEKLEFVADNEAVTGTGGVLELKDIFGEETRQAEYEVTFKALDTGTAQVGLSDVFLIDYADMDYIMVAPSVKHLDIGINKMVEEDARLSDLIVAPGELTEPFDPGQLDYEMHVGLDVENVGIGAIPMDEESVIGLEMPEKLKDGENYVIITVTALSGNVNTYTIKIIRKDWPEEEETTELSTESATETESVENTTEQAESTEEAATESYTTEEMSQEPASEEEKIENSEAVDEKKAEYDNTLEE